MTFLLLALACAVDDVKDDTGAPDDTADTADSGDTTDTSETGDTSGDDGPGDLTGTWLSEGENLSPLFAAEPFSYVSITADFGGDGAYDVAATDADGQTVTLTGTYVVDVTTNPGTIILTQTTPYSATAEGIWQVVGTTLTYEVVQTVPDYGFTPPTPETGFGSTAGGSLAPGDNVQVYVKQ